MRPPEKLVVSVVCLLGVAAGAPVVLGQAFPKSLIRMCLRNVATGIACYIVGRGGELIVDGTLSAAWAKAKETVTGEPPEDEDAAKAERQRQLRELTKPTSPALGKPSPLFANPIIEPIRPSELGSLSERLPGSLSERALSEGFLIYDVPKPATKPLGSKPAAGTERPKSSTPFLPEPGLSDRARTKSLLGEPGQRYYGGPHIRAEDIRPLDAGKLAPPTTALTAGQFGTLQGECQKRRERETGLSFLAIMGAPDFEAKLKLRMEQVIKPCIGAR